MELCYQTTVMALVVKLTTTLQVEEDIFSVISVLILGLLVAYPFISSCFPTVQVELPLYTIIIILFIILALPGIERIRARDIEVELRSPPDIGPVLSPSVMEMKIKEFEKSPER